MFAFAQKSEIKLPCINRGGIAGIFCYRLNDLI